MHRRFLALFAPMFLGACAISPGPEILPTAMCQLPITYLEVEAHDDPRSLMAATGRASFAQVLQQAYRQPDVAPAPPDEPISDSMLFLSGGSQNGAFGAGFLREWARQRSGGLPRFRVVTGISTGSIMATHAFLDRTDVIIDSYSIRQEKEVLRRYVSKGGPRSLADAVTVARRGAVGDLLPMQNLLSVALSDDVLLSVAREADLGRKLYVGAVDVDLGKAAIFDMTALAQRFESQPANRERIRECYVRAITASSSVPLAAPPTFIDNRMYIDGGARFGLISDEVGKAADLLSLMWSAQRLKGPSAAIAGDRPNIYLLVNGTLEVDQRCGKVDEANCGGGSANASPVGAHKPWNLLDLAQRSLSILINQVYRLSNDRIAVRASQRGFVPRTARIREDLAGFSASIKFPGEPELPRKCSDWSERDEAVEQPLEFHPRYMHCLIAYGAHRARLSGWAALDPVRAPQ